MCYVSLVVRVVVFCFFFKQKTAYEMRISDWSSDVCSSDLVVEVGIVGHRCGEGGDQVAGTIQLATVYRGFERERLLDKCCCVPAGRRGAIKGHHVAEDQVTTQAEAL